ncbi:MAG: type II secretion system F family protein [Xanthomonadales bacterium]|nr:Type II secretion system protein F [Xanthomonadales bacterium]MCC6593832.1 type II secretion system F family protein [Xanthomonadales bacterium]MCE7931480.1 type II secretion system F family protein [Xanthomonadales bacterium PRO6]
MATATATRAKAPVNRGIGQLQTFTWEGTDKRGMKLKGEELGKNANLVKAALRKQGINATKVQEKRRSIFGASGSAIKPRDIAVVSRQLATMMKAGVPLVQSFEMISGGQNNPRLKDMLVAVKTDIEGGSSLSEAINKFPAYFDELYVNLVRAGESAGVLDTVLDTIATYKENIETLKGKIKKALFYPAAVIAVAILVSAIILIYVVPQFEALFKGFGADLPAFTRMIVTASEFMVSWWWAMLLAAVGAVFAFTTAMRRSRNFARLMDRLMLRLPIIGQIMHNSAVARYCRTLAITFRAGVPLVEALETVSGATGSIIYDEATKRIKEDVAVGHQLNLAMKQVNLFPLMVVQMTAIGEESGALDTMLVKAAEFYEQEVNNAVDALSSLLEPFIMVIIGTLVGGLVIGMYLPIFKLAAVV